MLYLLLIPLAFALLRLLTRKYVFSALTTVSAGAIALTNLDSPAAILIACALFVSAIGDYFMAHRFGNDKTYALGIGGFFVGHALFIVSAITRLEFSAMALVVGLLLLGKEFGFKTFYVTIAFSAMLKIFEVLFPLTKPLTDQPFMELLLGVFLPAWGSALLFNIGSSTGGTDIIAMVVKKYFKCHIGKALLVVDFFITVMTFVAFGPTTGLFSMVGLVIRSFAVDFFLEDMNTYKSFTIITDKPEQIYNFITITLHRGATVYHAEGLYEHTDKTVILTAQNKKQGIRLQEAIKQADPHAFVLITNTSEVIGKGFRGGN